jgi:hypothetical protein
MNIGFVTRAFSGIRYTAAGPQSNTASGIIMPLDTGWSPTQEIAIVFASKPRRRIRKPSERTIGTTLTERRWNCG